LAACRSPVWRDETNTRTHHLNRRTVMFRKLILTGVLSVAGLTGATAPALANDCCCYKYVTCYECVTCYETRSEPYQKVFTYYDHCGKPYCVTKTCYRDVQYPVKKYVAVTKKVPCY